MQNICEWDLHAFVAYDAIHNSNEVLPEVENLSKDELVGFLSKFNISNNGKELMKYKTLKTYSVQSLQRIYSAIVRCDNVVDIQMLQGSHFKEQIDIMTYSFPCQDLSNVGAFHGYNKGIDKDSGSRSSLLWQVGRILEEIQKTKNELPRFLVLENVPSLLAKRHRENFEIWQETLSKMGYHNKVYLLNASNYGIPQNRPRLIMISILLPKPGKEQEQAKQQLDEYYSLNDLSSASYISKLNIKKITLKSLLRTNYDNEILLAEALECQPNDTVSRKTIWENNPKLVDEKGTYNYEIVRTLTTKQDRNPNSGNLYFDYKGNTRSKFRYLTPRECFLFMGFDETDFEKVIKENPLTRKGTNLFTRDKLIRMAGNSIPVNLLQEVFRQIIEIDATIASNWISQN